MSSHQPNVHTPNQAREEQRREEVRKEELERRNLEEELGRFDSHDFYHRLQLWSGIPVPSLVRRQVSISWNKKKPSEFQPIPVPRVEFPRIHGLAIRGARLLSLLKLAEERGLGCPYVHQINKANLEQAIDTCKEIQHAIKRFHSCSSMVARLLKLLHGGYIYTLAAEVEKFSGILEAIFLICRHEEFAQDLVRLRRAVTYRTGHVLGFEVSDAPFGTLSSAASPSIKKKT